MKQSKVLEILARTELKPRLKYFTRLGIFKGNNVDFNPETYLGHSYGWYKLTEKIKGLVILNSYNYSSSTCKHISKVRGVLRMLNIKYTDLEAPRGLQDLDAARQHVLWEYGNAIVAHKYSRLKRNWSVKYYDKQVKTLQRLGIKITLKALKQAVKDADERRSQRLSRDKENRAKARMKLNKPNPVPEVNNVQGQ